MNLTKIGMTLVFGTLCAGAQTASAELVTGLTLNNTLVTFDSATPGAVSAPVAITGLGAGESLLAIDRRPANGQLYGLGSASRLYVINTVTGAATQVGANGQQGPLVGAAYWAHTHDIRGTAWTAQSALQRPGLRVKSCDGTVGRHQHIGVVVVTTHNGVAAPI